MMLKTLPKEFKTFFGKVENKGRKSFITNLWFRMSDSANGSFTDASIYLGGWEPNSTTASLSLFRGIEYVNSDEHKYAINEFGELGKKMTSILNKNFKVKEVEFWECDSKMKEGSLDFASKYPYEHTPIRYIDGLIYPDEKLPSWRWLAGGMPYRQPQGQTDKKNIRVWDEDLQMHFYLEKVEQIEYLEEGLVILEFPYKGHDIYISVGNAYCETRRYNASCNNVWQTYNVTEIINKKEVRCDSYRGMDKMKGNLKLNHTDFYRIVKRQPTLEVKIN